MRRPARDGGYDDGRGMNGLLGSIPPRIGAGEIRKLLMPRARVRCARESFPKLTRAGEISYRR